MQTITPFLWFNDQAEEAANFYVSVFKDAKVKSISRYGKSGPGPEGSVMVVRFELNGQEFFALNGGPLYSFTPASSLVVACDTQAEIDELWDKLCDGGEPSQCGWLTDKYGLSWQIWPAALGEMIQSGMVEQTERMMRAMMQMVKLDLAALQQAFEQT
jgi:predicted 3-demethylubiquinone-9 3-methyltransferase (glyoxalase superfamily)